MKKQILISMTLLVALLAGCATSVTKDIKIDAEADPKVNFSGYSTYTWLGSASIVFDNEGRWEPPQFDADAEIKFLIDRELRNRSMNEDSANPDMFIAFAAGIDMDSLEIKMSPESDLGVLEQVPHGGLAVIMIDADTGFAIWAGTATANIQENPTQETIKKRLDFAVTQMFRKLP